jgi:hypothetical protein
VQKAISTNIGPRRGKSQAMRGECSRSVRLVFVGFLRSSSGKLVNFLVSLAASCWQGMLYGAESSGSCVLVGALIAVLWTVLEKLVSLEVQLVKFLISNSRNVV